MYTLIETVKENNLNPMEYLPLLFEKAPPAKTTADWKALLPWNIKNLPTPCFFRQCGRFDGYLSFEVMLKKEKTMVLKNLRLTGRKPIKSG